MAILLVPGPQNFGGSGTNETQPCGPDAMRMDWVRREEGDLDAMVDHPSLAPPSSPPRPDAASGKGLAL